MALFITSLSLLASARLLIRDQILNTVRMGLVWRGGAGGWLFCLLEVLENMNIKYLYPPKYDRRSDIYLYHAAGVGFFFYNLNFLGWGGWGCLVLFW